MDVEIPEPSLTGVLKRHISDSMYSGKDSNGKVIPVIPFNQYMKLCLYHPEYGYYRFGSPRVGREGDFYTSAYIGEVMGEQLASRLVDLASERFPHGTDVEVIDWGGGTGRLSRQILDAWTAGGDTGSRFSLSVVEGNPGHRQAAEQALEPYITANKARVLNEEQTDLTELRGKNVIIVANELLDAFPVHRVVRRGGSLLEWGVGWRDGSFIPCLMELSTPDLSEWVREQDLSLLENQTIEVNLAAADWVGRLGSTLGNALLVMIDYGDETWELTAPHRMDGTLLCYHKHKAHHDPFLLPGEQDITSHVNFTHVRQAAVKAGWTQIWYGTQKRFLVESGILQKLSSHSITDPFHPAVRRNRSIRQLLLSDGMSELFKVQILAK